MNYYGGKNLLAKLRARRRRAAKCKRLNLNCERVSICISTCKFLEVTERKNKNDKGAAIETAKIKKTSIKKEAPTTTEEVVSTKAPIEEVSKKEETPAAKKEKIAENKTLATAEKIVTTEEAVTTEATTEEIIATCEEVQTQENLEETAEENTLLAEEIAENIIPTTEPETAEEVVIEPTAEVLSEEIIEETAPEEKIEEVVAEEKIEEPIPETIHPEAVSEEKPAPKAEEKNKLDPTENADLLSRIATKRARKLIYAPKEAIYEVTGIKIDVDGKKNDKGVKVKDILEAEIKEGLRLGYLDKYDGLKASEIKEEYENDTVWEIAEQEFKKMGLLLDGDKIKVYVFDWTGTGCHHIGYIPEDKTAELIPYLKDMDKYSFDLDGIITGGKSKTVTKDEKTGKITITKGKDGGYGVDLDVTVINRKD